ncbi:MAG TPA: hypothetical protein VMR97_15065 [Acidimicrobiales bacterium]|nr:hypothetical protein [Acidimicrobiales bacterium]
MSISGGRGNGNAGAAGETLRDLVSAYASRRLGMEAEDVPVTLVDAEILAAGRPGIVDVVAEVGGRVLHLPLGLRSPGEESHFLPEGDDAVLGIFEDSEGVALVTDVLSDTELSTLLLRVVTGQRTDPSLMRQLRADERSVTLVVEDRLAFTVFTELARGPRLGLELLLALDEVGFNHVAAPIATWRRGERDLGFVQEYLPGASSGWALALTSVRDLYASGGPPEIAGGDFAAEARRLGTMTARMHLGLDEAFGRRAGDFSAWADGVEAAVRPLAPRLLERQDVGELLARLRRIEGPSHAIRTHGDFHLGRVYRTELGWYVGDLGPGGRPRTRAGTIPDTPAGQWANGTAPSAGLAREPAFRSPVADVADMSLSFGLVSRTAAKERDPTGREGLDDLAEAWEQRNRGAFLTGYLETPGILDLVPARRESVAVLVAAFELERTALRMTRRAEL